MEIQKKSNKENTRPKLGQEKTVTSFIKRAVPGLTGPLQSKNDGQASEKRAEPLKKPEQRTTKSVVSKPTAEAKKTQTLTQTFLSQQSASYKKLLTQGPKPVATVAPKPVATGAPKTLPGTYKGKVIQSKVDCFRKPGEVAATGGATEKRVFAKPAVPRGVGPAPAALSRAKSKSVATFPVKTAAPAISTTTQLRRPKSVTDVPLSRPASKTTRGGQTQTVSTVRQFQVTKRPATATRSVPPASSRPPKAPIGSSRPAPSTVKKPNEQKGSNAAKPPIATSQRPVRKPVTSTLSHTRTGMETVEERRAKLAEWLAAKGKTLKRPPIHSTQPVQRTRALLKPKADTLQQNQAEPIAEHQPAAAATAEPKSLVPEAVVVEEPIPEPEAEAVAELEPEVVEEEEEDDEGSVSSSPAKVMNTTLDMVDNCEMDLPEVDVRLENLVVNLCEALEAMETPSACQSSEQNVDEGNLVAEQAAMRFEVQVVDEAEEDEEEIADEQNEVEVAKNEIKQECVEKIIERQSSAGEGEDSGENSEVEEMEADSIEESPSSSDSGEESLGSADEDPEVKVQLKTEVKAEDDDEDDDDDDDVEVVDSCGPKTPECNGASVVKFSVRTTPYLQSMKKRIDSESATAPSSCGGSSRRQRKSGAAAAIGDLKFLTPVRRSRRIERQSARLPALLTEHDPCVTSLAELARLEGGDCDDEVQVGAAMAANAYIYRKNPALLDELPDGHGDLTRL